MKFCNNCWFYCHSDSGCYLEPASRLGIVNAVPVMPNMCCDNWHTDGLEDWEREPETLMTMEQA